MAVIYDDENISSTAWSKWANSDQARGVGLPAGELTDLCGTPTNVQAASCISRKGCYLPGYQLDGIVLKGLYVFESGYKDLLQLAVSIGLEGHPGET